MPQSAPLTLKVGDANTATAVFVPRNRTGGITTFTESSGVPIGDNRMTVGFNRTANKVKAEVRFTLPVVKTQETNGVSEVKLLRTAYANLTLTFDSSSTRAERDEVYFLIQSMLANPIVGGALFGLEELY